MHEYKLGYTFLHEIQISLRTLHAQLGQSLVAYLYFVIYELSA